jgi:tRNA A37 threonylcarbamoyladenosine modification protein TsaB
MLLSLDASLSKFSWCLFSKGISLEGDCLHLKHYESLPNYLEAQLDRLKILPREISKIAVIIGPGNYTGLRATLSLVRTWHMLYDTPVICKNRLETMLYCMTLHTSEEVMVSQSVRMEEFFILKGKAAPDKKFEITQPLLKIHRKDWLSYAAKLPVYGDSLDNTLLPHAMIWEDMAPALARWVSPLSSASPLSDITPLYIRQASQKASQSK